MYVCMCMYMYIYMKNILLYVVFYKSTLIPHFTYY